MCDAVLGIETGAAMLRELAESAAVLPCDSSGTLFRCHTAVQHHCESALPSARLYRRAAAELVARGYWAEAFRAYAHAQDWAAAAETLSASGKTWPALRESAHVPSAWLREDPWVCLADARRLRGNGQFAQACEAYREAESRFADARMTRRAAVERATLAHWLGPGMGEPEPPHARDVTLSRYLHDVVTTRLDHVALPAAGGTEPWWLLVRGIAAAVDGGLGHARELLGPLAYAEDRFVSLASRITCVILGADDAEPAFSQAELGRLSIEAESDGWLWLARIAHAAAVLTDHRLTDDALAVRAECVRLGDDWGALLTGVAISMAAYRAGADATPVLRETIEQAHRLGAVTLETWLRLLLTAQLTTHHDPGALTEVIHIQRHIAQARPPSLGVPLPPPNPVRVELRCFGRYEIAVDGNACDLTGLRRQAKTLLWLLSVNAGRPLHQEVIAGVLWPDVAFGRAKHRLHVAVSSVRAVLGPNSHSLLVRDGPAYRLVLPAGSEVDLLTFQDALRGWRSGQASLPSAGLSALLGRALSAYRGELIAEAGPAEWLLPERERLRTEAANATAALAGLQLLGNPSLAVETCLRGLRVDEYHYDLWRLLEEAYTRTGKRAAAVHARGRYLELISP
ncbi:BTAD domain-containing putative transcriptional regulator [Amycolatopsis sp. cg5]|uniref:BTAD domain-containing putative transcriptional regulator n=1 Tax=Amycolatopsis sp. cg5 TaxID=3238802 RepID=UPI003524938A